MLWFGSAFARACTLLESKLGADTASVRADTGRNAGIGIGVAALVLLGIAAFFFLKKKKKTEAAVMRKQESVYDGFQDGLDGDEMQKSAAVHASAADDGKASMRAATVSAYVRDANADDTLEQA